MALKKVRGLNRENLAELIKQHKKVHEDWGKVQDNRLYQLHESLASALEALGYRHSTPLLFEAKEARGIIRFQGTRGMIEESSRSHRHNTRVEYVSEAGSFVVDTGETWLKENVDSLPIVITHAHPDHLFGIRDQDLSRRRIYVSELFLRSPYWREEREKGYRGFSPTVFKAKGVFVLEGRRCVSVPVLHSVKAPNVALFFEFAGKRICHVTDVLSIRRSDREKLLKGCDIYIGDGSSLRETLVRFIRKEGLKGKPYGHVSVLRQLGWLKEANVPVAVFTHWGSEAVSKGDRWVEEEIEEMRRRVGYEGTVYVARDGSALILPECRFIRDAGSLEAVAEQLERGVEVAEIKDLAEYDPSRVKDDRVLGDDWRILLAWWSNYYAPKAPRAGEEFKYPKELILQKAVELAKEMIRRGFQFDLPKDYKPGARDLFVKVINAVGIENFTWKGGRKVECLWEVTEKYPGLYLTEPHARMLWTGEKTLIIKIRPYRKLANKPIYLLGDYVYGVGRHSLPEGPYPAEEVLVNLADKHRVTPEEFRRWWDEAKEVYLYTWEWIKRFDEPKRYIRFKGPQVYYRKVKLLESVSEASADALIRKLVDSSRWEKLKVEDREELMKKRQFIEPLYPFLPTKTAKAGYKELEMFDRPSVANLAKSWFEEFPGQSCYVEVKFDGQRAILSKKGDEVRIYTEGGERIDDALNHIVEDMRKLKADSVYLDSEMVPYDEEGRALGRRVAIQALGKGKVDDSRWICHVFDILYLNGRDLHKLPYEERRQLLRGLELPRADVVKRWDWHLVENIPRVATTVEEVLKYTDEVSRVKYSEGAMYKLSGSDYPINRRTPLWAKYKKFFEIDAMVVHLFPKRYEKGPRKGQAIPGQNNAACVVGPVTPPPDAKVYDLDELWKEERSMDHYKEWKSHKIQYVRYKGKVWSNIGITMSTAEDLHVGDVVRCIVDKVRKFSDTEYHWLIARVSEPKPEKTVPDTVETPDEIARITEPLEWQKVTKAKKMVEGEEYWDMEELLELSAAEIEEFIDDEELKEELLSMKDVDWEEECMQEGDIVE